MSPRGLATRAFAGAVIVAALSAAAGGCGEDAAVVGGTCSGAYTQCGLECVDLTSDARHCGACGRVCASGRCVGGACQGERDATAEGGPLDGAVDGDATTTDGPPDTDSAPFDGSHDDDAASDGASGDGAGGDGAGGDACVGPFNTPAACGDCFTHCEPPNSQCLPGDGGFACGPLCSPPLTECSAQCVDLTNDPFNCGACGKVCPSNLCQSSKCVGATAGHVVAIGHDYLTTPEGTAQALVLSNAVFIPGRNPLKVLAYQRYAQNAAVTRVTTILNGVATSLGRTLTIDPTWLDADIPGRLTNAAYAVLLVYDQTGAAPGDLAALGASFAPTLATFTKGGGVVVVLDGGAGSTREMPQFVTAAGLLSVTGHTGLPTGTPLANIAPTDVVGNNVLTPYGSGNRTVRMTVEPSSPTVSYVILHSPSGEPVVVHRLVP